MTQELSLRISDEMAEALDLIAKAEDATVAEIVRDSVRREVRQRVAFSQPKWSQNPHASVRR